MAIDAKPDSYLKEEWTYHTDSEIIRDLRSLESSCTTRFRIENKAEKVLFVYWIDFDGILIPYMKLHIGESREWSTAASHSWMITDETLTAVLVFTSGTKKMEQILVNETCSNLVPVSSKENFCGPWLNGFEWLPEEWQFVVEIPDDAKSVSGLCTTHFKIENTLKDSVKLLWVDYQGELSFHSTLAPGELHVQLTYATHPWLIQDSSGNNILFFTAGTKQMEYVKIA